MNKVNTTGISITTLIAVILCVLKVIGITNISWFYIIIIWLLPIAIAIAFFIIMIIVAACLGLFKQVKHND